MSKKQCWFNKLRKWAWLDFAVKFIVTATLVFGFAPHLVTN